MKTIDSIDPRTGTVVETVAPVTTDEQVAELAAAAAVAAPRYEALGRGFRAGLLRRIADGLEELRETIVEIGARESAIPENRLHGELTRTVYQARFFATVLEEGSYLEATIDHAGDTPMGPGPDLRRMLVPIGPVAVFGASNFPLAFSVAGGDTISALAAGSPVIVKAHGSHPRLSQIAFDAIQQAARETGAPEGVIGLVFGTTAGAALVAHPAVRAVGFTGSLSGGRALMRIINQRQEPIPFFGELSSLNPLIVSPAAAATRTQEIAQGLIDSVNTSAGQLCTKPGLAFVPKGQAGDALVRAAAETVGGLEPAVLLNTRISSAYEDFAEAATGWNAVTVVAQGRPAPQQGATVTPRLLEADASRLHGPELEECFGPTALIVRYDADELEAALNLLPSSLTGTVHSQDGEEDFTARAFGLLRTKAGRLLHNGYPTGVLVSWAQHHGGPWPATNTQHTSVGATAIRRWLRPITWQNAPETVLPEELREAFTGIPRRIDGQLVLG